MTRLRACARVVRCALGGDPVRPSPGRGPRFRPARPSAAEAVHVRARRGLALVRAMPCQLAATVRMEGVRRRLDVIPPRTLHVLRSRQFRGVAQLHPTSGDPPATAPAPRSLPTRILRQAPGTGCRRRGSPAGAARCASHSRSRMAPVHSGHGAAVAGSSTHSPPLPTAGRLPHAALSRLRVRQAREPRQARLRSLVPLRQQRGQRCQQLPLGLARGLGRAVLRRVHPNFRLAQCLPQPRCQATRQPAAGPVADGAAETPHPHARGVHAGVGPVGRIPHPPGA